MVYNQATNHEVDTVDLKIGDSPGIRQNISNQSNQIQFGEKKSKKLKPRLRQSNMKLAKKGNLL
jgi:hypothetical protein